MSLVVYELVLHPKGGQEQTQVCGVVLGLFESGSPLDEVPMKKAKGKTRELRMTRHNVYSRGLPQRTLQVWPEELGQRAREPGCVEVAGKLLTPSP